MNNSNDPSLNTSSAALFLLSQKPLGYSHQNCLLCGNMNPFSLRLGFKNINDDGVEAQFQGNYWLQGYEDLLHGGVVSALLDSAMTNCLMHKGIEAVTGELKVRYFHPVPCRAEMTVRAYLMDWKSRLYILRSELWIDDTIYAHAKGKFMKRECLPNLEKIGGSHHE